MACPLERTLECWGPGLCVWHRARREVRSALWGSHFSLCGSAGAFSWVTDFFFFFFLPWGFQLLISLSISQRLQGAPAPVCWDLC